MTAHDIEAIVGEFVTELDKMRFGPPIAYVYNPLKYAGNCYLRYWRQFGRPGKQVLLLGMNPGPWGMAQTGIPFGDPGMVEQWLGISMAVGTPERMHPKRLIQGFTSSRSEVSGKRLWGWARQTFGNPGKFFQRFWVDNYCPLIFMEASGRNRTPDKLPKNEKETLLCVCDDMLRRIVRLQKPEVVIGVGVFAADQARRALADTGVRVERITHPSPANPRANKGWEALIEHEMADMGIDIAQLKR